MTPGLPELGPDEWRTRDGRIIKVADMETAHLENTIAYLLRRAPQARTAEAFSLGACLQFCNGEQAGYAIENDMERILDMDDEEFCLATVPSFREMLRERDRRDGKEPADDGDVVGDLDDEIPF